MSPADREGAVGKTVGAMELSVFLKAEEVPYTIGSKWNVTIKSDGSISVEKAQ